MHLIGEKRKVDKNEPQDSDVENSSEKHEESRINYLERGDEGVEEDDDENSEHHAGENNSSDEEKKKTAGKWVCMLVL